jgi:energy-coupling factor transporter ATP-binding protein EcfA2
MIELTNVTYSYPQQDQPALNHLSLSIKSGEAVCVMGANGSGKSTFAALLAGLVQPQGGRLTIDCQEPTPLPVGILFQNPDNQMVAVTVEKEVAFALENLGTLPDEMERRIGETLERFRISHLRRRLTAELSGGEKQRVALASVMVMRPPILVLDEPDSFLDEAGKRILVDELERIKASTPSLTEIRITQYPHVARSYSRLIVFDQGGVAADGRPDDIFADPELCLRTGLSYSLDADGALPPALPDYAAGDESPMRLVTDSLGFAYGNGGEIVRELNLDLAAGETIGVVGPSSWTWTVDRCRPIKRAVAFRGCFSSRSGSFSCQAAPRRSPLAPPTSAMN